MALLLSDMAALSYLFFRAHLLFAFIPFESVAELIKRANETLEIEPQGTLQEQAEAVLSALVGASHPYDAGQAAGGDEDTVAPLASVSLADANFDTGRPTVPESTLGGETTCSVCFTNPKSHVAAPCGHQCACGPCSARMESCPICRAPVLMWMQLRVA
ncbi:hypothetical protein EMIHUDRAFT_219306 [Emiliania huxleyi CCMP1516]|uniref:RING-type domain-containing protein n=2 Tax=Emiliania huxleyi TaxID=2903 RepID=A0A0D3I575_EMIH1|nr:hypothetical protein EMIHUDRAFT_219306 [Emiliania huxleyi CCMP1516]EOD06410.1 hypothetical protein EMIHUDRAFT_219306 [Emiliania huxleyi CCMP1516]|eukprot:XP_005758839.1 hypothetical protein EMIHUDRAFT_219306 [Emiliania huxleyi CCMP1516]